MMCDIIRDCEDLLHNDLIAMGESVCFLCDNLLDAGNINIEDCCSEPNIEADGIIVCTNCGCVRSSCYDSEFIDFYKNVYKIERKSIYYRKYHIENTLNILKLRIGLELTYHQRNRVYKVFDLIGTFLNNVNDNRKRLISIKFILRKILIMMKVPCDQIFISKSKQTIQYYERYFDKIMSLIGDKIHSIIVN